MIVHMCQQGSAEWLKARSGHPTASDADKILTPKTMKPSASAEEYACEIVADIIRGGPEDVKSFTTKEMERGSLMEPEARRYFTLHTGLEVQQTGHCTTDDGKIGASFDGLIGLEIGEKLADGTLKGTAKGGLELKCPLGKTQVRWLSQGGLPAEYRCQVHTQLIVGNLECVWFLSYASPLPPLLVRVVPDDFTEVLRKALTDFCQLVEDKLAAVRSMC